jgi:hypothetical protein
MNRLLERVEQELQAAAAADRQITERELSERLAAEFSAECGQSEVRAAVNLEMRRRQNIGRSFTNAVAKKDPASHRAKS